MKLITRGWRIFDRRPRSGSGAGGKGQVVGRMRMRLRRAAGGTPIQRRRVCSSSEWPENGLLNGAFSGPTRLKVFASGAPSEAALIRFHEEQARPPQPPPVRSWDALD